MNNDDLPLVSVITPSLNQGQFIQETIESVLVQNYPNIEYIVIDGGSTDGTLQILESYRSLEPRFKFISEPDRGQAHAINKGLKMAKGEIIGWLNSDDTYLPGSIIKAVEALESNVDWAMVYGKAYATNEENKILYAHPVEEFSHTKLFERCIICQPAAFIRKKALEEINGIDEEFFFCMDYDLWMRLAKKHKIGHMKTYLANARYHDSSKSILHWQEVGVKECFKASLKNYGMVSNMLLSYFIKLNYEKGIEWIMEQLKQFKAFGDSPKVLRMNHYDDLWSPQCLDISLQVTPNQPLHSLLIKGRRVQSGRCHLKVFLNGRLIEKCPIANERFTITVLLPSQNSNCDIQIITDEPFIPAQLNESSNDQRALGFLVDKVVPLSVTEYEFIQILSKGTSNVNKWLKENRKVNPFDNNF